MGACKATMPVTFSEVHNSSNLSTFFSSQVLLDSSAFYLNLPTGIPDILPNENTLPSEDSINLPVLKKDGGDALRHTLRLLIDQP